MRDTSVRRPAWDAQVQRQRAQLVVILERDCRLVPEWIFGHNRQGKVAAAVAVVHRDWGQGCDDDTTVCCRAEQDTVCYELRPALDVIGSAATEVWHHPYRHIDMRECATAAIIS